MRQTQGVTNFVQGDRASLRESKNPAVSIGSGQRNPDEFDLSSPVRPDLGEPGPVGSGVGNPADQHVCLRAILSLYNGRPESQFCPDSERLADGIHDR